MIKNNISFTGYDARKLDGFVMKSNHGNVANEMIDIGQKEGFNVYFLEQNPENDTFEITTNKKQPEAERIGGWPQDLWGFIGKKLLTFEYSPMSDAITEKFKLTEDKTQVTKRSNLSLPEYYNMINTLLSMPHVELNGHKGYLWNNPETGEITMMPEDVVENKYTQISDTIKELLQKTHIEGGNYYFAKNKSGEEIVLVGKDERDKFSPDEIEQMLGSKNVIFIPQMDYHMDLYLRPLDNGRILLTDDRLTKQMLVDGFNKIQNKAVELSTQHKAEELVKLKKPFVQLATYAKGIDDIVMSNDFAQTDETAKVLEDAGFEVIRVPGRLYETRTSGLKNGVFLIQLFNFMNANVLPNKKGELIYITNKSDIDENTFGITPEIEESTGFSVQKSFTEALKPYIKEENIYFVSGDNNIMSKNLKKYQGGIHCMCTEVPAED